MKTVLWQACSKGVIGTYQPATGKMLGLLDSVKLKANMKVSADVTPEFRHRLKLE